MPWGASDRSSPSATTIQSVLGKQVRAVMDHRRVPAQVLISKNEAVAGRVVGHVRGLEAEVDVLKHLDHPNIVRYLARRPPAWHVGQWLGARDP